MASTRKSSRVRVPKIREDAAVPAKRMKGNAPPTAATTVVTTASSAAPVAVAVPSQPQLSAKCVPSQPQLTPPSVPPATASSIISLVITGDGEQSVALEETDSNSMTDTGTVDGTGEETAVEKVSTAIFKNPSFVHSSIGAAGTKRTRVWKNLKQIIATERSLPWKPSDVTYSSIEGPPSFKPAKKYSDLSGLEALYTDPQTKLRFANPEEFSRVRSLPSDLVTGYLALRKASASVP